MNFFERQDEARRQSRWMVVLFVLAVVAVVVAVDFVVFTADRGRREAHAHGYMPPLSDMARGASAHGRLVTTLVVLAIIALASFYKTMVLRRRRRSRRPLARRRARLAPTRPTRCSGACSTSSRRWRSPRACRCREVYLLEQESGINAFAAGHNPSNAAIGVTRGTLDAPRTAPSCRASSRTSSATS